ncbi:MAG: enoyl-CoA hydratase-related protein [Tepidiformaceae bacterium]
MPPRCTRHDRWALVSTAAPPGLASWLQEELEALREDPTMACVAIDASGAGKGRAALPEATLSWLARFELPTICFAETAVAGAWFALALACDIRICGAGATFRLRGDPSAWQAQRLRTLLGDGAALTLLRGETFDATAALEAGLVSEVVPAGTAPERAAALAATIASRGPIATRLAKEAIWRGLELPFAHALRFEHDLTLLLQTTKDRAEGVRAFMEKRPPRFSGE